MDGKVLATGFKRNLHVVLMQVEGLTHEDALTQPPYNVNCMNWTLGHLVHNRDVVLTILGGDTVEPRAERYANESDPVTADGDDVIPLADLLSALERQQAFFEEALTSLDHDDLEVERDHDGKPISLVRRLSFMLFHDTYHTGQTELLRQMSGKTDNVI